MVRLHSALIAVLTHLVGKLRAVAVRDPQVAGVVFPLLNFSTSLGAGGEGRIHSWHSVTELEGRKNGPPWACLPGLASPPYPLP